MAAEEEVELIIRSAYQSHEDITFSCSTKWTVLQIKEHVHQVSPNKPPVSNQRLIFSGASLQDDQVLADILLQRSVVDGAQIFHLVCSQPYISQNIRQRVGASSSANANNVPTLSDASVAHPVGGVPPQPPNIVEWNNWWTNYSQNIELYNSQYQAYYQQWMRYYASYGYQFQPQNANFQQNLQNTQHQPIQFVFQRVNNQVNQEQPAIGGVAGAANNLAPQPGERVDGLELFYRLFKLILLFSAVLIYSSFERFALVLVGALFIYFVQVRRNQVRNQAAAQAREAPPPPPAQAAEQVVEQQQAAQENGNEISTPTVRNEEENNDNGRVNNNNTGENENAETTRNQQNIGNNQESSGMQIFFATCYSFITSFFASLVPDHPMPVDIN